MSHLTTAVQENITGVRTVKSFARESFEIDKFSARSDAYKSNQIGAAILWARYFPVMELLASMCAVILLIVGGRLVINHSLTLGQLVAFFSMVWYIIGPMWSIGFQINNYTQAKAAGERLLELLNQYVHVKEAEAPVAVDAGPCEGPYSFQRCDV